ncbi:MAG: hypothetical protein FJ100_10150 [Deltaproteobacteria bacterium]|nr:hypothetical protein [Deltaproteobacteria bacterium]
MLRGLAIACTIAVLAWLSLRTIVQDLASGAHLDATHKGTEAPAPRLPATALAAAGAMARPTASPAAPMADKAPPAAPAAQRDPVATAILAAARDHLARKVAPTVYSVDDLRANAGNHLDLIERGTHGQLPIKTALVRHRARHPHLYGLQGKPPLTLDERKRAWNGDNLEVFLRSFALLRPDGDAQAGDIAVLRRLRGNRKLVAVVTDVTDEAGRPQFVVLDPAERSAREVSTRHGYHMLRVFHLGAAEAARARQLLDLAQDVPGTAL